MIAGDHGQQAARLVFVRHAQTVWNAENRLMGQADSPLTEQGLIQAHAVAARLVRESPSALLSSDLGRAIDTAAAIAMACGIDPTPDPRLRERHAGAFQGRLRIELRETHPGVFRPRATTPDTAFPGGESPREVAARVLPLLEEILLAYSGRTTVLVTHGGVLRVLLWRLLGVPFAAVGRARVENTGISIFAFEFGEWVLESWNDAAHTHGILHPST